MLTGLKVSSLVRKCVFYRPEPTGKWGSHGTKIEFLTFKTEIYQRIELKWGHSFGMFTPRVKVIKMSVIAYFMYFLLDTAKNQSWFG